MAAYREITALIRITFPEPGGLIGLPADIIEGSLRAIIALRLNNRSAAALGVLVMISRNTILETTRDDGSEAPRP